MTRTTIPIPNLASATRRNDVRSDIARVNLELAAGLPHGDPDVDACLRTLDEWTALCAAETRRATNDFKRDPDYYDHSRATFTMMCVVTVLQRDLGIRYNPAAIGSYSFADSRDSFLHGLLTGRRRGTCVNIPVLYVAVARRLGYPVHLALAKGHVLARWQQDHGETLNIEGTGIGLTCHPDEHYRQWPRPMTDAEAGDYLRPLSPGEERAVFLGSRGHCLEDNGRSNEALACYDRAAELQPRPYHYAGHARRLRLAMNRPQPHFFFPSADSFASTSPAGPLP